MPISHKYKAIFVHIPKTAGTSIEKAMNIRKIDESILRSHKLVDIKGVKYAPQHFTSNILKRHKITKPYWDSYFKFAIVRHPYSRVLSEYFWVFKQLNEFDSNHFSVFLDSYYLNINSDHKLSQYEYLTIDGELAVDYVGKFENLDESFEIIKNKIDLEANLPKIQVSNNKTDYLKLLTKEQKQKIFEIYKDDFTFFGYKQ